MSTHYYYLLVNLGCIIVPFLFSFHPKLQFYKKWKAFIYGVVAMMLVFIPWDMYFTSVGVWGFNPKYITGIYIGNIPIEEVLFFICIPYACLFTYHCMKVLIPKPLTSHFYTVVLWLFALLSLFIAALYTERAYTFVSHLVCGLFLLLHLTIPKSSYLNRFLLTYTIIFIPFIITNGILTGLDFLPYDFINVNPDQITEKIVWYDNAENLGIRLFTIPIDDISYGFFMLLLVTSVYEWESASDARKHFPKTF